MKWLYKVGANEYHNKLHAIQDNIASENPVTLHAPKEYAGFDFFASVNFTKIRE